MTLTLTRWPWHTNLTWRFWRCTCMPNINFLGQGFRKFNHYRETDATERITTPRLQMMIRHTTKEMWHSCDALQLCASCSGRFLPNLYCACANSAISALPVKILSLSLNPCDGRPDFINENNNLVFMCFFSLCRSKMCHISIFQSIWSVDFIHDTLSCAMGSHDCGIWAFTFKRLQYMKLGVISNSS